MRKNLGLISSRQFTVFSLMTSLLLMTNHPVWAADRCVEALDNQRVSSWAVAYFVATHPRLLPFARFYLSLDSVQLRTKFGLPHILSGHRMVGPIQVEFIHAVRRNLIYKTTEPSFTIQFRISPERGIFTSTAFEVVRDKVVASLNRSMPLFGDGSWKEFSWADRLKSSTCSFAQRPKHEFDFFVELPYATDAAKMIKIYQDVIHFAQTHLVQLVDQQTIK